MSDPIIVALSGGVDSAVAALLLQQQGFRVEGLFMSNWDEDDRYCTLAQDFQDARQVCERLRIPLHRASFAREYRERVFTSFVDEYARGRTPNPDVLCNRHVKFGAALNYVRRLGSQRIATGHYARAVIDADGPALYKAADASKDQSYFLHAIERGTLGSSIFPLGDMNKSDVRRLAHAHGFEVHDKPDSTGICFIGERPFEAFLTRYVKANPGPIENDAGRVIGQHRGLAFYTLGQRAGLRIGGTRGAAAAPWYVAAKDTARNVLIAVQTHDHELLMCSRFSVTELHWLRTPTELEFRCAVKTRYRQTDQSCQVVLANGQAEVIPSARVRAVAPGQYAVFYDGARCLGGGVISERNVNRIDYNDRVISEAS